MVPRWLRSPPAHRKLFFNPKPSPAQLTIDRYCLPKAVLQLAWRPVPREGTDRAYEVAIAGEDSSLRVYAFSEGYLGGS